MQEFDQCLAQSTASIPAEYFALPVLGLDPVYRERVYCYELYHQLRCRWPPLDQTAWRLNGEVDKRLHPYFRRTPRQAPKPDFLIHEPGSANNFAVIEVKARLGARELRLDLTTLRRFRARHGYERALQLVYATDPEATRDHFRAARARLRIPDGLIELWVQPQHGAPAQRLE